MNNQATIQKMEEMRLSGMLRAFRASFDAGMQDSFTADEMVAHLIDAEWEDKYNKRFERLLKNAKFRYQASMEQIDYKGSRNIEKNKMLRFSSCDWITKGESIIISGATGVGKSYLACALGHQACIQKFKVSYYNCLKLFSVCIPVKPATDSC